MTAAAPTRDRVLAYVAAHLEKHGEPPATKLVCLDLGMSKAVVCRALARLIAGRRLQPEQRNPRAANAMRNSVISQKRTEGLSKPALAKQFGLSVRHIGRISSHPSILTGGA